MGIDINVAKAGPYPLGPLLEKLSASGLPSEILMIDGALVPPGAAPAEWRDVRLRTPAGSITLTRRPAGISVVVFGNADEALQDAQRRIAQLIEAL
jgi:hypothetical protein